MVGRWVVGTVGDWQVVGRWLGVVGTVGGWWVVGRPPTQPTTDHLFTVQLVQYYPSRGFLLNGHNFRFRLTFLDFEVVL